MILEAIRRIIKGIKVLTYLSLTRIKQCSFVSLHIPPDTQWLGNKQPLLYLHIEKQTSSISTCILSLPITCRLLFIMLPTDYYYMRGHFAVLRQLHRDYKKSRLSASSRQCRRRKKATRSACLLYTSRCV